MTASLVLGTIWAAWHLPLFLTEEWGGDTNLGWFVWNVLPLSLILTWLFLRPGGSVIPAMLFHGGTNVIASYFPLETDIVSGASDLLVLRGSVYWAIGIVLLITTRGRLGSGPKDPEAPGGSNPDGHVGVSHRLGRRLKHVPTSNPMSDS